MEVSYTLDSHGAEANVDGTSVDFLGLAALLLQGKGEIKTDTEGSPAPYDKFLKSIIIKTAPGQRVTFSATEDGDLLVAGESAGLEILAGNLKWFAEGEGRKGDHIHEEYYPDHFYLAQDSIPIVFMLKELTPGPDAK
jgi:hypothetical protein